MMIAPMTTGQLPMVCRLADAELGKGYLSEAELLRTELQTLVASESGTVIGFITCGIVTTSSLRQQAGKLFDVLPAEFQLAGRLGKIGSLVVEKSRQQQGIGTRLLSAALEELAGSVQRVFLLGWRSAKGTNVQPLVRKLGFEQVAVIRNYWQEASQQQGYTCPVCGRPPCHCSAVIFCKVL